MKTPFILTLLLLLLFSCEKDDNETADIIVSGRIVQDCNGTPLANKNIEAWVKLSGTCLSLTGCTDLLYTTTDANGNFSFKTKKGGMEIRLKGSNTILYGIPVLDNINLGTFNAFPSTSFVYKIKINNTYSIGDTLQLSIYQGINRIIIPAPLFDTIFPIVNNYTELASQTYGNANKVTVNGLYDVTKGALTYQDIIKRETFSFSLPSCPATIDTITIEIN